MNDSADDVSSVSTPQYMYVYMYHVHEPIYKLVLSILWCAFSRSFMYTYLSEAG